MKRIVTIVLALALIVCLFPANVLAEDSKVTLDVANVDSELGYQTMTTSRNMLDIIKDIEGFYATPYWDVSQWSIGYGTACGYNANQKPDIVWTEEYAETMLVQALEQTYGAKVNAFFEKIGKQPSQQQFDALVSFTYNLGPAWMNGTNRLTSWLKNPSTEEELVNAMGIWCRVNGSVSYSTACRRLREAIVFLYGEYTLPFGNTESELKVVSNGALPYYKIVIFQGNGGTIEGKSDAIKFYKAGESYGALYTPSYSGYELNNWVITRVNNNRTTLGNILTTESTADKHYEVTASWTKIVEKEPDVPGDTGNVTLSFSDVTSSDWHYPYVEFVFKNGYMLGTSTTTFAPNIPMTRGMLVQVLYRIAGSPAVSDDQLNCFTDIGGRYYTRAIAWAKANGIVAGISDTEFAPNAEVTRQDAICIFYKMYTVFFGLEDSSRAELSQFKDANSVESYAVDQVKWAVSVGMLSGMPEEDGLYISPRGSLTRAQAAAILMQFVNYVSKNA